MELADDGGGEQSLLQAVAQAADLCRKPWRHATRFADSADCLVLITARDGEGERQPALDLELEIYRSGEALHLMVASAQDQAAPLLWHGNHPVWMDPQSGARVERPQDGAALEAMCRRLLALLDASAMGAQG